MPPYSVDLAPIDTDCSIVKRHVIWMPNIEDRHFRNDCQIWCNLNSDDPEVMRSAMSKRIQAVISKNGDVTRCKMTCQIFAGNEISSKIKRFGVTVLYMCFDKT